MNVVIHNWGFAKPEDIEACGFIRPDSKENWANHGQYEVTKDEMFSMVQKLFDAGLNVMLMRRDSGCLIMVNTGKFSQR